METFIKVRAVIKFCLAAILIILFSSCSKKSPECEEWEVVLERFNVGGCIDWSCSGSRTLQLIYCGDGLKDARAGNIITTSEDQCCRKTTTFKRFIRKV